MAVQGRSDVDAEERPAPTSVAAGVRVTISREHPADRPGGTGNEVVLGAGIWHRQARRDRDRPGDRVEQAGLRLQVTRYATAVEDGSRRGGEVDAMSVAPSGFY